VTPVARVPRERGLPPPPGGGFLGGMQVRERVEAGTLVVLDVGPESGPVAMAREAELAERARRGEGAAWILRIHGWADPVLTLGKTQDPPPELRAEARAAGVVLARRPTGGGWLLHLPGDLAVTLVARGPLGPGDFRGTARLVGEAIAAALARRGTAARAAPAAASPPGTGRAEVCFQRVDREEVKSGSTKVAGVALARAGRAALVQAAIPLVPAGGPLSAFESRWDPRRAAAVGRTAGVGERSLAAALGEEIARRLFGRTGEGAGRDRIPRGPAPGGGRR